MTPLHTSTIGQPGDDDDSIPRYRLDVVAESVSDVVSLAAGWLFDHAMAGWDVTVALIRPTDNRALRILGTKTAGVETVIADSVAHPPAARSLAAFSGVWQRDRRIHTWLHETLHDTPTTVTVWGRPWPPEWGLESAAREYHCSNAAAAFKRHALCASGIRPGRLDHIETYEAATRRRSAACQDAMCATAGS